jgi:hypothetical protein
VVETRSQSRIERTASGWRLTDEAYRTRKLAQIRARCVTNEHGCLLWQGDTARNGYGQSSFRSSTWRVHRIMFTLVKGPIPAGLDCLHTCDNRRCCNPDHLFVGTRQANHDDMWAKGRAWQQKETCRHGHPWSKYAYLRKGTNKSTGKSGMWRHCKECFRLRQKTPQYIAWRRDYQRRRRAEKRAARLEARA